ncbi:MAG: flippase [Candidatus Omnitrophica bacterium]|nr:flippase [Candidatus Omnitrophota bacterium]
MFEKIISVADVAEFKRYFANTSWMFCEKIVRAVASLIVGVYVARYLGPSNYGLLNYAISFVFIFSILAHLNIESIIVRDLSNRPQERDLLLGTAFYLRLAGSLLAFMLIWIILYFHNQDPLTNSLILIIAAGLFCQAFNVIDSFFQANVQSKYTVIAQITQIVISSGIKIFLVLTHATLISFAAVILVENIILALALAISYKYRNHSLMKWQFSGNLAKKLLKNAFPLFLAGIAVLLYMRLDQILIKFMIGNEALGNYSVVINLCESSYFIPVVLTSSLFPAILDARQKNRELYDARIQRLYRLMVKISLVVIIPTLIWGDQIMFLLFGPAFNAPGVLKIYILGFVFTCLGVASSKWLLAEDHINFIFYRTLLGLACNVGLNFLLIPKFDILGAAYSFLAASAMAGYFSDLFHHKTRISFKMKTRALLFLN